MDPLEFHKLVVTKIMALLVGKLFDIIAHDIVPFWHSLASNS